MLINAFARRPPATIPALVLILLSAGAARAQGTSFTYQGRLTDGGAPANGNYDLQFALWDSASGGNLIGPPQSVLSVPVSAGSFAVTLDFGATAFPGADRFLEISVRLSVNNNFTTLSPRQQISSTPYSVRSLNSTSADGLSSVCAGCVQDSNINSISSIKINGTIPVANGGTGLNSPGASGNVLKSNGSAWTSAALSPSDLPSGNGSYIQNTTSPQSGSSFNIDGNGIVGGMFGIGTTNPSGLQVNAAVSEAARGVNNVRFGIGTGTTPRAIFEAAGSTQWEIDNNGGRFRIFNPGAEQFTILSSGNTGIGTTTPSARLAVRGDGTNVLLGSAGCGAPTAAIGFGTMSGCTNFTLGANITAGADFGTFLNRPTGNGIHFRENNLSDQMTIAPGGNVGIGTNAPASLLHLRKDVAGDVGPTLTLFNGGGSAGAANSIDFYTFSSPTPSGPSAQIQSIDDGSFSNHLVFSSRQPGIVPGNPKGDGLIERMRIASNGNVGIGTDTPSGLQVNVPVSEVTNEPKSNVRLGVVSGTPTVIFSSPGTDNWEIDNNNGSLRIFQPSTERFAINVDGLVGIGTFSPAVKLQVLGDIRVGTSGNGLLGNGCLQNFGGFALAGSCSSDARLKRDIRPFPNLLDKVTKLQPVHYYWRSREFPDRHFGDSQGYGLVAQDVEQVLPELVGEDAKGYKTVDYSKLPLMLLQAIKELKAANDALRQQNATIDARLKTLEQSATPNARSKASRMTSSRSYSTTQSKNRKNRSSDNRNR